MRWTPTSDATATLRLVLPFLPEQAVTVLKHRYGLFDTPLRTPTQIGQLMQLTVAQVCRIEHDAIDTLRQRMGVR